MKYQKELHKQTRYHPMIIKFCLGIQATSPAAYEQLRFDQNGNGVLVLPSKITLRDYRNYISPKRRFNSEVINQLQEKNKEFSAAERFTVISFDEMKIQNDLVWDKNTGELIGFLDLGDVDLNNSAIKNVDKLASHVLVIMIRSVMNPMTYTLARFAIDRIISYQVFPIF